MNKNLYYYFSFLLFFIFSSNAFSSIDSKNKSSSVDQKQLQTLDSTNYYFGKDTSKYEYYSKLFDEINFNALQDSNFRKLITGRTETLRRGFKYEEAIPILLKAVKVAKVKNDTTSLALFHKLLSTHYFHLNNYDSTLIELERANELYDYLGDKAEQGIINLRKARVAYTIGNHEDALRFSFEALEMHKDTDDHRKMAISYLQLGNTFYYISNFEYAKKYFALARVYFKYSDDMYGYNEALSNLGTVDVSQEQFREGIKKQKTSLEYWLENNYKIDAGEAYNSLVAAYLGLNQFDSCHYYVDLAKKSFSDAKYQKGLGSSYLYEAKIHFNQKKFGDALESANMANEIVVKYSYNYLSDEINYELYRIHKELNNESKSFFHLERYVQIKDSLNHKPLDLQSDAMKFQLAAEEAKWNQQLAEERAHIQSLESEKTKKQLLVTIAIAIITFILLFVAVYYLLRNKRLNKKLSSQREIISEELKVKEALLSEIHHRVKNNLQVVSSMLSLQMQYISNDSLKQIIEDSKGRINSMALIHESLYRKKDFKEALFNNYIKDLLPRLLDTYGTDKSKVKLEMNLEPIKLSLDDSIPCGLIINEIITNSLKHAFPNGNEGTIKIDLKQKDQMVFLTISDNGIGLKEDKPFTSDDSFGFLLIESLANQLEAEINLDAKEGFNYHLSWKNNHVSGKVE